MGPYAIVCGLAGGMMYKSHNHTTYVTSHHAQQPLHTGL